MATYHQIRAEIRAAAAACTITAARRRGRPGQVKAETAMDGYAAGLPGPAAPGLWRWHAVVGAWRLARACAADTGPAWLDVWQAAEPGACFRLSVRRPARAPERAELDARRIAELAAVPG